MSPRISVIVIGYNIEQYISQCLESVLAQDYNNFELIFVDDGSRDNTLQAAQKFSGDSRVKIIHKENGGCVSARKAGVRGAQGEYICFVDGDDWLNPDMLSNLVSELDSHSERVDIAASRFFFQNSDGSFHEAGGYEKYTSCKGYEFFELMMSDKIFHSVFPKLYRREFAVNAGFLEWPVSAMGEDLMMNCFFALNNPVVVVSKTVNYYYRYNVNSASRNSNKDKRIYSLFEMGKTIVHIESYLKHTGSFEKYRDLIQYQWLLCFHIFFFVDSIPVKCKRKFFEGCRDSLQGFRDNKYCLELWARTRRSSKLIFTGYEKCPRLMYILEPVIILLRKCVTASRLAKKFITRK